MGATKAAPKIPAVTTLLQSSLVPVVTIACIPKLLLSPPCKNVPKQKPFRLSVSHEFNSGRLLATLKCLFKVNHPKDVFCKKAWYYELNINLIRHKRVII